ncbi:L-aspartate oxidase [Helicobacter sp.]|uniref:L-aspartate oxidase n=1 Tax=Helicobacter sp. TaxID=218 RepID=UPI0025BC4B00|nr:FAD-binding protein [Helicobacter sp.]MCI5968711.1 FAD-binding protein [Helicobacter sp.]MDY2584534.1 FAD-binding protein [Helicobacter sp.]
MLHFDVIIVGAGVAGLYASLNLPKHLKVLILCKDQTWECNTFYAQGGIAVAKNIEDIALHIKDTLEAGAGMCNEDAVKTLSEESLEVLEDLVVRQTPFDKDSKGNLLFTKEAAHSTSRIIHAGGDSTGRALHSHLMAQISHTLWKNATVTELLIENNHCYGVSVLTKRGNYNLYAKHIILASGGVGALFEYHTNAYTISSELHGMILENGLKLKDMEMLQFHPTVFVKTHQARKMLLSEALRGEGAKIVDFWGKRFLFDYDTKGELASRDKVARSIFDYKLKLQEKFNNPAEKEVYLDLNAFSKDFFYERFPNIARNLSAFGYDLPKDRIPISPAFHYCMGGIETDGVGKVVGMKNLYAVGECACTGVHGANRLASNSLLEGLVFSRRSAKNIVGNYGAKGEQKIREFLLHTEVLQNPQDENLKAILRNLMWSKVGIMRKKSGLNEALGGVEVMLQSGVGRLLRLRLLTAKNIIESALKRDFSVGAHYLVE